MLTASYKERQELIIGFNKIQNMAMSSPLPFTSGKYVLTTLLGSFSKSFKIVFDSSKMISVLGLWPSRALKKCHHIHSKFKFVHLVSLLQLHKCISNTQNNIRGESPSHYLSPGCLQIRRWWQPQSLLPKAHDDFICLLSTFY